MLTKHEIRLDTMRRFDDGKLPLIFQAELQRALLDCVNRPAETRVRKVALVLELTPVLSEEGECENVAMAGDAKATIPSRRTNVKELSVTKQGHAFFTIDDEVETDAAVEN